MWYHATINPGDVIAVGDIHGRFDLFHQFLLHVKGTGARVILLGDMIDRGPDDLGVLNAARNLCKDPEAWGLEGFTALIGNHEWMLLNALDGYGYRDWVHNGGNRDIFEELAGFEHWIRKLPYFVTVDETLFAHAGLFPGENPELSLTTFTRREQFLWNRGQFLEVGPQFEKWNPTLKEVVFGHTPRGPVPYSIPNGICIDTGAFQTGFLTAYNATRKAIFQFTAD